MNGSILAAVDGLSVLSATVLRKYPVEEETTNGEINYDHDTL
jgi:hypothetical protein